jgi:serine/threonine-protein kinase
LPRDVQVWEASLSLESSADLPSDPIKNYRLVRRIAQGGMGEVFLARQEGPARFAKWVVIKRVLPAIARNPESVEMFLSEARLAAQLTHPNIVQIFELGQHGESFFIAMEYVHGRSVREIIRKLKASGQRLPLRIAARIAQQTLEGLHYAHSLVGDDDLPLKIIHRDATPDNILVSYRGDVKLVDFGIAKAATVEVVTQAGAVKGKFPYLAPEQFISGPVDARTDIYTVGVGLYECVTGVRPFAGPSDAEIMRQVIQERPVPAEERNPDLPPRFAAIIARALAKNPDERFSTAEQMAQALEEVHLDLGTPVTSSHLGAFMRDVFGDDARLPISVTDSGSMPAIVLSHGGKPVAAPPAVDFDAATKAHSSGSSLPRLEVEVATPSPPPRSRRWLPMAVSLGVALTICLGGIAWLELRHPARPEPLAAGGRDAPTPPPEPMRQELPRAPPPAPAPLPPPEPSNGPAELEPSERTEPSAPKKQPSSAKDPTLARQRKPKSSGHLPEKTPLIASTAPAATPYDNRALAAEPPAAPEPAAVAPTPGRLMVRVNPWGEVMIGNKSFGVTPIAPISLAPGKQTITIRNSRLNVEKKVEVTIPSAEDVVLKVDLLE